MGDLCVVLSSTMQPKLSDCCLVASVPIMVATMPCGFDRWNASMSWHNKKHIHTGSNSRDSCTAGVVPTVPSTYRFFWGWVTVL